MKTTHFLDKSLYVHTLRALYTASSTVRLFFQLQF